MSELKLIELDIKGKKFDKFKRKYMKLILRILAAVVILSGIAVSGWLIATNTNQDVVEQEPPLQEIIQPTATPVIQPAATPIVPLNGPDITKQLITNNDGKKVAYLTFDDGPSNNTEIILNILDCYGIKATFFVTGENAEKNPHLIQKIYDHGHSIANHTYSHVYSDIYENSEKFIEEVMGTQDVLAGILGAENVMPLFRFPGGSFGEKKQPYLSVIENIGYKYVDWNCLNGDAEGGEFTHEMSLNAVKEYSENKEDVVILMHDTAKKNITAESLPAIIEYLVSQGFGFDKIVVK